MYKTKAAEDLNDENIRIKKYVVGAVVHQL